jgi:hypothetical protein
VKPEEDVPKKFMYFSPLCDFSLLLLDPLLRLASSEVFLPKHPQIINQLFMPVGTIRLKK